VSTLAAGIVRVTGCSGGGLSGRADFGVERLAAEVAGEVITRDHAEYEAARRVWNGMIDRRPAVIVRCSRPDDVAVSIAFAADLQIPVAVRGGAHNVAGNATCDDGLVIDLGGMKGIDVGREARRARAAGGVRWGEFDRATQRERLATTGGLMPSTGIAGFTLGGGLGHLMRSCGLACDNLVSAEVVTADGTRLRADEDHHADLFWALRGGGGNFGVVTEFEFRLHDVGPQLLAGRIAHRLSDARDAFRFYRDFCADAPDSVIVYGGLTTGPDREPLLGWRAVVNGSLSEAEPLLAPLRAYGAPILDDIQPRPYLDIQRIVEPAFPPGRLNYWKANFVDELSDELIDVLIAAIRRVPSPYTIIAVEQMGGAVSRVAETATAFQHRKPAFSLLILSGWVSPADTDANVAWTRELWEQTRPLTSSAVYVNYLGSEGDQRVHDAFGVNNDRLARVKQQYDPGNFFRLNQNIQPATLDP
jgi:FAD binding domain/Berberine and berberine like